jgi:hypothetical protein
MQTQPTASYSAKKVYTGIHPMCNRCRYHHATNTSCQFCTSCNRLGHFAMNYRTNPTPITTVSPAPQPSHNRTFTLTTAPTVPTPQLDLDQNNQTFVQRPGKAPEEAVVPCPNQSPDFYDYVVNS